MSSTRDYAFEALAEVTNTDWNAGRGELNSALKSIREQSPEIQDSYLLGAEIHDRAKLYGQVMGAEILLTPNALAKHWKRVAEAKPVRAPIVNATIPSMNPGTCGTCDGHKLVLVGTHPSKTRTPYEEYAPCPDCNSGASVEFWRADGSRFRSMDPALVRTRMVQP
jgi:hypothetical protein